MILVFKCDTAVIYMWRHIKRQNSDTDLKNFFLLVDVKGTSVIVLLKKFHFALVDFVGNNAWVFLEVFEPFVFGHCTSSVSFCLFRFLDLACLPVSFQTLQLAKLPS